MAPFTTTGQPYPEGSRQAGITTAPPPNATGEKATRRHRTAFTVEFQRVVILLTGGGIGLLFLLLLARSLNPADHELLAKDLPASFAPLDGRWIGQATLYNAQGEKIADYSEQRTYHSSSTMIQTVEITRAESGSTDANYELWVNRVTADGTLLATRSADPDDIPSMEGTLEAGHYFWRRETPTAIEIHRVRLAGNNLIVEELLIPHDKQDGLTILSGRLQRTDTVDHSRPRGIQ